MLVTCNDEPPRFPLSEALCTVETHKVAHRDRTRWVPAKILKAAAADACCAGTQACLHNARTRLATKFMSVMSTTKNKDEKLHEHPVHRTLEGVVESGLHASLKEVLDTLSDDETIRVISKVVHAEALEGSRAAITESLAALCSQRCMEMVSRLAAAQALTMAETSTDPLCRKASRLAAKDIVMGSYDAMEQKQAELMSRPYIKYAALPAAVLLALFFFIPLCLCLWRFGLYGMGCFK